jgi:hypothetical protein
MDEEKAMRRLNATVMVCLALFLVSCLSSLGRVNATIAGTFHFRGYFDGSDYLYIQDAGGKVWYEHIEYDYPGEHTPYNSSFPAPTTLDGVDWYPVWDRDTRMSDTYVTSSPQNYPSGNWTALSITKITNASDSDQSRGPVTIEDYPSSSNDYTAKVLVNDDTGNIVYFGAAWYEFELSWEAPNLVPEYPFGIISVFFVLLPVTIGVLLYRRRRE